MCFFSCWLSVRFMYETNVFFYQGYKDQELSILCLFYVLKEFLLYPEVVAIPFALKASLLPIAVRNAS